jgi:hypothetical protein
MTDYMLKRIEMVTREEKNEDDEIKLTRGTRRIIKEAINETGSLDKRILCSKISDIMIEKYTDKDGNINEKALEYQSVRMNLSTTSEIGKAIDLFFKAERQPRDVRMSIYDGCLE